MYVGNQVTSSGGPPQVFSANLWVIYYLEGMEAHVENLVIGVAELRKLGQRVLQQAPERDGLPKKHRIVVEVLLTALRPRVQQRKLIRYQLDVYRRKLLLRLQLLDQLL